MLTITVSTQHDTQNDVQTWATLLYEHNHHTMGGHPVKKVEMCVKIFIVLVHFEFNL